MVCCDCRARLGVQPGAGARFARFFRACALGLGAAFAGFLLYYGVAKVTGLEIGLISILVGLMVGRAVRKGSEARGGWAYQALAVFLTYSAIAASYSAMTLPELMKDQLARAPGAAQGGGPNQARPRPEPQPAAANAPAAAGGPDGAAARPMDPVRFVVGILILLALSYALPIIAGVSSPIGLLIVGFALWEAWKINRRVPLVVNGPFRVALGANPGEVAADV